MRTLRSINVLSAVKIGGIVYFLMGLLYGVLAFVVFGIMGVAMRQTGGQGGMPGGLPAALVGVAALVGYPIGLGVMGAIGAAIMAWLYNVVAGWVGGLEIELR